MWYLTNTTNTTDKVDTNAVELIPILTIKDDIGVLTDDYIFTNLFLVTVSKSPGIIGYYINSIDDKLSLDYEYVNSDSIVQFICNNINIYRNAIAGEDVYKITVALTPTLDDGEVMATKVANIITDLGILKIKIMVEDNGVEICYLDTIMTDFDELTNIYTFEATLSTTDYMTFDQYMQVMNINNTIDGIILVNTLIPMYNCKLNVYAFYKYSELDEEGNLYKIPHIYDHIAELQPYTLTNKYSTVDKKVNFISPLNILRSMVNFTSANNVDGYDVTISAVPFVSAPMMKDPIKYNSFMKTILIQYEYMQNALSKVTNNYGIDMKFYNTYGRSNNFIAGDLGVQLDNVNTRIYIRVKPSVGSDVDDLILSLKVFIKKFIESINALGSNGIYISNLITSVETNFSTVEYMRFGNLNDYDSSVQIIENRTPDITSLSKIDRQNYVPEYLTISLDDIIIDLL